jgi:3-oxoacyl-[acyl-carrier protein] reductase
METGLAGKVVIVTGASEGIGAGIARCFAREGTRLAVCARRPEPLAALAGALRELGAADALAEAADCTRPDDIARFAAAVQGRYGEVHVLVNCVGGVDQLAPFEALEDADWQRIWDLNVMSAVRVIRAVLPLMREHAGGRIVNIASESGVQPDAFMPHYNAAKGALITFTKSLSKALGPRGILVNAVSPSMTRNADIEAFIARRAEQDGTDRKTAEQALLREMRPNVVLGRPGEPEEVGAAVVFLASAQASFVTGANLRVDGGSVATIN